MLPNTSTFMGEISHRVYLHENQRLLKREKFIVESNKTGENNVS